jgi:lipopolysaccharide/colanic/teichoic acid biosynthesis glycosyltransferase
MCKRTFDILLSLLALIVLLPVFLIIGLIIKMDSRGPVFFRQQRIGKDYRSFRIFKFRTMYPGAEQQGMLTIGRDQRITRIGHFLRRYKLDELPQLFNVLIGDMSLVGPRPEVSQYVALYNDEQKKILKVKPGITDLASIEFANENEMLAGCSNPEEKYIREIMPAKLRLNLRYLERQNLLTDLQILAKTFWRVFVHAGKHSASSSFH